MSDLKWTSIYGQKSNNLIVIDASCTGCQRQYMQKWIPQVKHCEWCLKIQKQESEIKQLKEEISILKAKIEQEQQLAMEALEKAEEWHERDLEKKVKERAAQVQLEEKTTQ